MTLNCSSVGYHRRSTRLLPDQHPGPERLGARRLCRAQRRYRRKSTRSPNDLRGLQGRPSRSGRSSSFPHTLRKAGAQSAPRLFILSRYRYSFSYMGLHAAVAAWTLSDRYFLPHPDPAHHQQQEADLFGMTLPQLECCIAGQGDEQRQPEIPYAAS